jgi:TolB-like protein
MSFFAELKRRNVVRVGIAYGVLAWVVIQVTDTVAPALKLPDWTLPLVVWIGIIGLPFALFLSWAFELTPEGLKREHEVDRSQSMSRTTGRRIDFVIIGLLAVAVVFMVVDNYVLKEATETDAVASDQATAPVTPGPIHDSIAVLPFLNMSNDAEQDYLSDGLAEELLNLLARIKGLKVAARTSSFAFRGQEQDIRKIGEALGVSTVLEGSVRKSGSRLRITAQLISVDDGYHLWSEAFDRELTDIFQIQDEISAAIVSALRFHLDAPATAGARTSNLAAYDLYPQGQHEFRQVSGESRRKALELLRKASEADPEFAAAWAAQAAAVIDLRETQFQSGIPAAEAFSLAEFNIKRALELDPQLPEAHVAQGMLHWDRYQFDEALASIDKAIAINPNLAEAHRERALVLQTLGRIGEAKQALTTATELDPLDQTVLARAAQVGMVYGDDAYLEELEQRITNRPVDDEPERRQEMLDMLARFELAIR